MATRRRRFLQLSIGGAALLAGGGGLLRWLAGGYALGRDERPLALSTKELVVVHALVRALLPRDGGLPSGESLGIPRLVDEQLWAAPAHLRSDLKNGLQLLEHAPPLFGYASRYSSLSPDDARACLAAMLDSSIATVRQVAIGMRQVLHLLYYAQPDTYAACGYEGPWVAEPVPPESHRAYERARRRRA